MPADLALRLDVRAAEDHNVVIGMLVLSRDDDLAELNSLAAEVLRLGPQGLGCFGDQFESTANAADIAKTPTALPTMGAATSRRHSS